MGSLIDLLPPTHFIILPRTAALRFKRTQITDREKKRRGKALSRMYNYLAANMKITPTDTSSII